MTARLERLYEVYPPTTRATMPLGVRVNDLVYTTSLAGTDPETGQPIAGGVREQTAAALERMKDLVEGAGGSLDNVGRAVAFCTSVEDRALVDEVWTRVFPDPNDKPAFKVLLAELPDGHLVRIDALAQLGARRQRIDIPNVRAHDPTVRIGNWTFSSRCHGNDPATGQLIDGGLEAQVRQTFENLATLAALAGGSGSKILQITTFGRDASYLPVARRVFEQRFPGSASRPALNQLVNFVAGQMQSAVEMTAVLEGTGELFQELYLSPETSSVPAGAKIGPVVIAPMLLPVDPRTQQVVDGGMKEQLRAIFQNMDRLLEAGGASRQDVARITLFMSDVSDRSAMNQLYSEWYPDPDTRPPHKYVPAQFSGGILAGAQVIAVPGGSVRALELPGIRHQDYMSLGGICGNLVASSRIVGTDPESGHVSQNPEEHTANVFRNAERLLQLAGGGWDNLQQATVFIGGQELRPTVEKHWTRRVAQAKEPPQLHFIETNLGGQGRGGLMLPRLEILALL